MSSPKIEPNVPEKLSGGAPKAPSELPPVEPPSARFIVQLFLIPLGIVVVLVVGLSLVYLAFGSLATGGFDAAEYARAIRSGNENRRWRAAYDLASLIHNDSKLSSDPKLLGELSDLLQEELGKKDSDPRVQQYLALTIGSFQTLKTEAAKGTPTDPIAVLVRALEPGYKPEVRVAAALSLSRQAERMSGLPSQDKAVAALIGASKDDDSDVRQRATYALGFLDDAKAREALYQRVNEDEDRMVTYNAAAALARQGDGVGQRVLREMLSTKDLQQVIKVEDPSEIRRQIDAIELEAILSLQESVKAGKTGLAESLKPELAELSHSGSNPVKVEAASLLKSLPGSGQTSAATP